ncbi:MAG: ankyrin repeat domain-containing protein [Candidatus Ozemobacteraceae bacterium]
MKKFEEVFGSSGNRYFPDKLINTRFWIWIFVLFLLSSSNQMILGSEISPLSNFELALENGDPTTIRKLISEGADVNAECHAKGNSVNVIAISNGNIDILKFLIESGANCNIRDTRNYNPLMQAISNPKCNIDFVKLVIEQSPEFTSEDIKTLCDEESICSAPQKNHSKKERDELENYHNLFEEKLKMAEMKLLKSKKN